MSGSNASEHLLWLWAPLGLLVALATLPGTLELLWLTIGAMLPLPKRRRPDPQSAPRSLAVVVPAHNEELGIESTVRSLCAVDRPEGVAVQVVVIADNCTDATARLAEDAGARVLERASEEERGKGYALDFAFKTLMAEGVEAFLIIDADTVVEQNLITEAWMAFARGADAVQAPGRVRNADASWRTRLLNVAIPAMNTLRPRGREHWGLSVGLVGNGWGVSAKVLEKMPYTAFSVVEDLEYHLMLVENGYRVRFLGLTTIRSMSPSQGPGVTTQRTRWEGGRMRMMKQYVPKLFAKVRAGELHLLEPLLDLLLLSLAYHVLLLGLALILPFPPTQAYALFGFSVVVVHVLTAVVLGGGGLEEIAVLAMAPFYILWKLTLAKAIRKTATEDADWHRTEREAVPEDEVQAPKAAPSAPEAKPEPEAVPEDEVQAPKAAPSPPEARPEDEAVPEDEVQAPKAAPSPTSAPEAKPESQPEVSPESEPKPDSQG